MISVFPPQTQLRFRSEIQSNPIKFSHNYISYSKVNKMNLRGPWTVRSVVGNWEERGWSQQSPQRTGFVIYFVRFRFPATPTTSAGSGPFLHCFSRHLFRYLPTVIFHFRYSLQDLQEYRVVATEVAVESRSCSGCDDCSVARMIVKI